MKTKQSHRKSRLPKLLSPAWTIDVPPTQFSFLYRVVNVMKLAPVSFLESFESLLETIEWDLTEPKGAILGKSIRGVDDADEAQHAVTAACSSIYRLTTEERIAEELEDQRKQQEEKERAAEIAARFEKEKDTWFHAILRRTAVKVEDLPAEGVLLFKQPRDNEPQLSAKDLKIFEFDYSVRKQAAKKSGGPSTYFLRLHNEHADLTIRYTSKPTKRPGRYMREILCSKCGKEAESGLYMYIDELAFVCERCRRARHDALLEGVSRQVVGSEYWDAHYNRRLEPRFRLEGGAR